MVTRVWITDDCTKVAVQVAEEIIFVTDYSTNPATVYNVDVLGAEWFWLPVSPDGVINWIAVEQA
jgi:hypothetical protein